MTVNWQNLAIAASCGLEIERLSGRGQLVDEASLVRLCAEFAQSTTQLILVPEHNHPDLSGTKRLDLLGKSSRTANADFVMEAKWIRSGGGARQWQDEVAEDALRLESLTTEMSPRTERVLVVGGISRSTSARLIDRKINPGAGRPRVPVFQHLLQGRDDAHVDFPYPQERIPVRDCDQDMRKFWKARATALAARGKSPAPGN